MLKKLLIAGLLGLSMSHLPARAVGTEGLVPIGNYQSHRLDAQVLKIECQDGSQVQLHWLAPDLVRVRSSYRKPLDSIDASWAIAKRDWPPVEVDWQDQGSSLRASTSEMTVVVQKSPLKVEFRDAKGRIINADHAPLLGDPNGRYRDKLFDPEAGSMLVVTKKLGLNEHFYALGEKAHKLDRRRGHFSMWNSDTPRYVEGRDPIYQSIPFYIGLDGERAYGLFYDNSYRSHFDFGHSQQEFVGYAVEGGEIDYYLFAGPSMPKILSRYTELTGRIYLPPKWALGHQASRWSYYPDSMVEEVAATYQSHDLPLDVMTLDIDYMQKYRVFTWDRQRFPDPAGLTKRLKSKGLETVTIVDPGVKYQPSQHSPPLGDKPELLDQSQAYYVFDQGLKGDYFVKRKSGQPMVTSVWPGETVFVDYTKESARKWWGDLHRAYLEAGVGGIWNDMNEPADFTDKAEPGENQRDSYFEDLGRQTKHAKNRNLVALLMCRSTYEGLLRLRPNQRPYVITRAAYAGIQRYATMWTGDAPSSWESLALSIPMFCNLGLSGETFIGADVGGFMNRGDGELLTRAYQVCFLVPFCRNHKDQSGYDQEPWRFGPFYEGIIRKYLKLRYRLLPYLYAGLDEARRTGMPFIRPLVLNYQNDPETLSLDDQYLAGNDLLLAPALRPGQETRRLYLPQGQWYDFYTGQRHAGRQTIKLPSPIESTPLLARGGSIIPMGPDQNTVFAKPNGRLTLRVYTDASGRAEGHLYEDDGRTQAYQQGQCSRRKLYYHQGKLQIGAAQGSFELPKRPLSIDLYTREKFSQAQCHGHKLDFKATDWGYQVSLEDDPRAHEIIFKK